MRESTDGVVRFGRFELNAGSGLLRERTVGGEVAERRLAPQPAALLLLLREKGGEIATREEIRQRLWPDVTVEFEASLHHCVRQVRAALGESAKAPRYVETVPRRGYRLCIDPVAPPVVSRTRGRRWVVLSAGVALAAAVGAVWWSTRGPSRCRLAIMPFSTDTMSAALASDATAVGEQVLFEVTRAMGDDADVLGPRTTGPALASGASLPEIAEQLDVTHVVNVKHMGDGHTPRLLVELIRVHDGRHVWVERLDRLDDDTATALSRGIVAELSR